MRDREGVQARSIGVAQHLFLNSLELLFRMAVIDLDGAQMAVGADANLLGIPVDGAGFRDQGKAAAQFAQVPLLDIAFPVDGPHFGIHMEGEIRGL